MFRRHVIAQEPVLTLQWAVSQQTAKATPVFKQSQASPAAVRERY